MTLDLEAELESAQQAYLDNAGWQASASVAMAGLFVAACQKLLMLIPTGNRSAGRFDLRFDVNLAEIAKAKAAAEKFVGASTSGVAVQFGFENSR